MEAHVVLPNCPADPSEHGEREAASEPASASKESTRPLSSAEGGAAAAHRGPARSGGAPASPTDEALASIDARLKALQGASSRVELQLENQQMHFALMMDAFNQLQNKATVQEIGSVPLAQAPQWKAVKLRTRSKEGAATGQDLLSIISPFAVSHDSERNERASSKDSAWTRSGTRLKTAPLFSSQEARSAGRTNTAPTPHLVQDFTDGATPAPFGSPKGVAGVYVIPESAQEPSELRATATGLPEKDDARGAPSGSVDGSRSAALRMPIVGRRKLVPDASQDTSQEPEADAHGVSKMVSNRSNLSSRGSPAKGRSGAERAQESETDTASYPLGFWDDMQQSQSPRWRGAPSTGTDMSKVNQVLQLRAEDVARAASLGTGGTLLDDEVDLPPFMLPPQSRVHLVLATLMAVAIVYTGLLSPMALAYFKRDGLSASWAAPMYVADGLWLVYILVAFRTAFYDPRGVMVVGAREIASNYARRWLLLDLLCAWPAFLAAPAGTAAYSTCMVLKLLRTPRLAPLISLLQKEYRVHALLPLKWGLVVLLLSHSLACFWRLLQCDVESHISPNIPDLYCEGNEWWHRYVSDMYWMAMTLSTVGYGDIPAFNTWARVFNIFVMLLSPVFFGSVVAALSNVMDRIFDEKVESCVSNMSRFMRRHSVPQGLQLRVERSLRQVLNNEVNITPLDPELFARLSPALQRTFSFAILSGTIGRFPLFRGAIHSFVAELAQAHMLVHCSAGDLVGETGQLVEDLVFVVNGELVARFSADWPDTLDVPSEDLVQARSDEPAPRRPSNDRRTSVDLTQGIGGQRILRKGAWFGEASVLGKRHVRTASIIAQGPTELAVLNREEYSRVMNKYPSMAQRHERLVQEMSNSTICLADISWSEAPSAGTRARRRSMEWLN